jgi:hypothetical protein
VSAIGKIRPFCGRGLTRDAGRFQVWLHPQLREQRYSRKKAFFFEKKKQKTFILEFRAG